MFFLHGWFPIKFVFTYNTSFVWWEINFRSSHWRRSVKKDVLKNFAKCAAKHLCQSLLATLLKRRLWNRCFPVNFPKFLRTPFVQNTFCTEHLFTTSLEDCFWNFKHWISIRLAQLNIQIETFKTFEIFKNSSNDCLEWSNKDWKALYKNLLTKQTLWEKFSQHCLTFPKNGFTFVDQKFAKNWKIPFSNV